MQFSINKFIRLKFAVLILTIIVDPGEDDPNPTLLKKTKKPKLIEKLNLNPTPEKKPGSGSDPDKMISYSIFYSY